MLAPRETAVVAEAVTGGSVRLDRPGALVVVGAEPGDLVMVDVLGVGRPGGRPSRSAHPGLIGCVPEVERRCPAPLTAGSRILLPVHVPGAELLVDELHFPGGAGCDPAPGWIELRVHLTRQGVSRFHVTAPTPMPPAG